MNKKDTKEMNKILGLVPKEEVTPTPVIKERFEPKFKPHPTNPELFIEENTSKIYAVEFNHFTGIRYLQELEVVYNNA